jgi:hypothetical protein
MPKISDTAWVIADCIFPTAQPLSQADAAAQDLRDQNELNEARARIAAFPNPAPELVRKYLEDSIGLLDQDKDRRQSVESRLTSIMGLSSIAGTVVFGGILAQATGTIHSPSTTFKWGMASAALYLTLQLCSAILAAVRGLSRKTFEAENSDSVLPQIGESEFDHYRRRAKTCMQILIQNRGQTNAKVTQMAVAHRAMKNFLLALLLIALAGTAFAVRSQGSNDIIETLRKNHELTESLRGPQGLAGPKGEPGAPCVNKPSTQPPAHKPKNGG